MRFYLFIGIFLVSHIVASNSAHAAPDRCPPHNVKADLKAKLAKTKRYTGTSKAFTEYVQGHSRGQSRVLGFVNQAEIYTKMRYKFGLKEIAPDRYCVMLENVTGYFYAAPKLYMPNDYSKSSCEYQQIFKHEKRHLQAVYDFHEHNTGKYASYLGKIARAVPIMPPVSTQREIQQAQSHIANYFESKFREQEYKSMLQLRKIQANIDSPQEYRGVQKRCSNW